MRRHRELYALSCQSRLNCKQRKEDLSDHELIRSMQDAGSPHAQAAQLIATEPVTIASFAVSELNDLANSADANAKYAQYRMALIALEAKQPQLAAYWFCKAAKAGLADAQFNYGFCLEYGRGVTRDCKEAIHWYEKSAAQSHLGGTLAVAKCVERGAGVPKDEAKALALYRAAAELHPNGKANLGVFLLRARPPIGDPKAAVKALREAAAKESTKAKFWLAHCLWQGIGVDRSDFEAAADWFERAASAGDAAAQFNLGCLLERGNGRDVNQKEALKCFKLSEAGGDVRARIKLSLYRIFPDDADGVLALWQWGFENWKTNVSTLFKSTVDVRALVPPFSRLSVGEDGDRETFRCRLITEHGEQDAVVKTFTGSKLTLPLFHEWLALSVLAEHPNVRRFRGVCENFVCEVDGKLITKKIAFVSEFEAKGSIEDYFDDPSVKPVTPRRLLAWAVEIARGLHHLHKQRPRLVHCDLAARNVLLKQDEKVEGELHAVVNDFDLLLRAEDTQRVVVRQSTRTPTEGAPEVIMENKYSPESDMFSWALTVFEIATSCKEPIFDWSSDDSLTTAEVYELLKKMEEKNWSHIFDRLPKDFPVALRGVMRRCLSFDSTKRPTAAEVVEELERAVSPHT